MVGDPEVDETEVAEVAAAVEPVVKPRKPNKKAAPQTPAKAKVKAKGNGKAKVKAKARKPRTVDPAKLDSFGFRKGSLKSRAAAMYAKPKGATLNEVKKVLESTQFNLLTELEGKGFKIKREKVSGKNDRPVIRFHIAAK